MRCGSAAFTSVTVGTFCLIKYSIMLRRNNCERVKSCLAQKSQRSQASLLKFENLSMVLLSSMLVFLLVVDNSVDDIFLVSRHPCNKSRRKFNGEI